MEKKEIRKKYKTLRDQMDQQQVSVLSGKICEHIVASSVFQNAEYIFAYYPLGNEADVRPVVEAAWVIGKRVAFPKVFGDVMSYFEIHNFSGLHPGAFGVMEPAETHPVGWNHALVLTPGVAFDQRGNRMGFGRGYYDKFLAGCPECITIGVAYGFQLTGQIPVEATDIPLDYMVTETGMWKTKTYVDIEKGICNQEKKANAINEIRHSGRKG